MVPGLVLARSAFVDVEASGLMAGSFPVEVAWVAGDAEGSILLRPGEGWDQSRWDPAAEGIHGIPLSEVRRRGRPPVVAAARLEEAFAGRFVFTDSPERDREWLDMLHAAASRPRRYRVLSVERLLLHLGLDGATAHPLFAAARAAGSPDGRAIAGARHLARVADLALENGTRP